MRNVWGLVVAVTAVAGVGEAEAQAPTWCNVDGLKDKTGGGNTNMDAVLDQDWNRSLDEIIKATCWPDDEGKQRKREVDAARAAWSAKLGMAEEDWRDMAEWAANVSAAQRRNKRTHQGGGQRSGGVGAGEEVAWGESGTLPSVGFPRWA